MLIILFILVYIAFGSFTVTLFDKYEAFRSKDLDGKLLTGLFWPFLVVIFLLWLWGKFCVKISKKILRQ
jgi:hypothetical protein